MFNDKPSPEYPDLVKNAIELMHINYAELYGVEELAQELMVSKSHLIRVFSASVGISPGKYLTDYRVAVSKCLLTNRAYTVEVVATLSGFSGANYFCKVFRNKEGMSPMVYRKSRFTAGTVTEMTEMEKRIYL